LILVSQRSEIRTERKCCAAENYRSFIVVKATDYSAIDLSRTLYAAAQRNEFWILPYPEFVATLEQQPSEVIPSASLEPVQSLDQGMQRKAELTRKTQRTHST
jgi:hypothetical protein